MGQRKARRTGPFTDSEGQPVCRRDEGRQISWVRGVEPEKRDPLQGRLRDGHERGEWGSEDAGRLQVRWQFCERLSRGTMHQDRIIRLGDLEGQFQARQTVWMGRL